MSNKDFFKGRVLLADVFSGNFTNYISPFYEWSDIFVANGTQAELFLSVIAQFQAFFFMAVR